MPGMLDLGRTPLTGSDEAALAAAEDALLPEERRVLDAFPTEKRRQDWLLGRAAAKGALRAALGPAAAASRLAVLEDAQGAPCAFVAGQGGLERLDLALSLSHGHGHAIAWARAGPPVGVDLERIRERPEGTFRFYLDPDERAAHLDGLPAGPERDARATILWSLKEAAWKVLRPGRGTALLHVKVEAASLAPEGRARARYEGPAADRARSLGLAPAADLAWTRRGDLVLAWAGAE